MLNEMKHYLFKDKASCYSFITETFYGTFRTP